MIVVSDSTILIGLAKLGKLDLLREIFSKVYIPEEVYREVAEKGKDKPGSQLVKEGKDFKRRNTLSILSPAKRQCTPEIVLKPCIRAGGTAVGRIYIHTYWRIIR